MSSQSHTCLYGKIWASALCPGACSRAWSLQRCEIGTLVTPHVPPLLQGRQEQILVLSVTPSPELPHSSCSQPVLALGTSPHLAHIAGEGGMFLRGQLSAEGTRHGGQGTL